mgnify:CR=1 FL=1
MLFRSDPEQPKQSAPPRIPSFFDPAEESKEGNVGANITESDRRIALARWITNPTNPLTARVIANRLWQGHFGTGIVATPNDFGMNGLQPTHPELLDWLANDLVRNGWSLKKLHRKIVLSKTYRQSASMNDRGASLDADARLLWRYPKRRLEAEAIRDTFLFVSGELNPTMYGRGFDLFDQRGGLSGFKPIESYREDGLRRMIYAHKIRREREAVFGAFDCPDAGQSTGLRRTSTTPIQALNLLNSRFTIERSKAFAERVKRESDGDLDKQLRKLFELSLMREPTQVEISECSEVASAYGLEAVCRAILNSNEFLFIP